MTHADAFLQDILEHPDDAAPRLILADWLDEHGQPDRAELIRVQCELARGTTAWKALRRRERELLDAPACLDGTEAAAIWAGEPLCSLGPGVRWEFRRGFVEAVTLATDTFLAHAAVLFRSVPIREVTLSDLRPSRPARRWGWYRRGDYAGLEVVDVPPELFDLLEGATVNQASRALVYDTEQDARAALSRACVAFGRSAAGLPPPGAV